MLMLETSLLYVHSYKAVALINMYTPSEKSHAWIRKQVHQTASRYLKKWATFDG